MKAQYFWKCKHWVSSNFLYNELQELQGKETETHWRKKTLIHPFQSKKDYMDKYR